MPAFVPAAATARDRCCYYRSSSSSRIDPTIQPQTSTKHGVHHRAPAVQTSSNCTHITTKHLHPEPQSHTPWLCPAAPRASSSSAAWPASSTGRTLPPPPQRWREPYPTPNPPARRPCGTEGRIERTPALDRRRCSLPPLPPSLGFVVVPTPAGPAVSVALLGGG